MTPRRRALAVAGILAVAACAATAADAMVSAHGHGEGRAHVMGAGEVKTVGIQGGVARTLVPGEPGVITGTIINDQNRFAVQVSGIQVSIQSITGAPGPCSASDFEVKSPTGSWIVAAGETKNWSGGSVTLLNDETHSPNGCLGATAVLRIAVA